MTLKKKRNQFNFPTPKTAIILAAFLFLGLVLGMLFRPYKETSKDGWLSYTHERFTDSVLNGFKLYYPKTWTLEENKSLSQDTGVLFLKLTKGKSSLDINHSAFGGANCPQSDDKIIVKTGSKSWYRVRVTPDPRSKFDPKVTLYAICRSDLGTEIGLISYNVYEGEVVLSELDEIVQRIEIKE